MTHEILIRRKVVLDLQGWTLGIEEGLKEWSLEGSEGTAGEQEKLFLLRSVSL